MKINDQKAFAFVSTLPAVISPLNNVNYFAFGQQRSSSCSLKCCQIGLNNSNGGNLIPLSIYSSKQTSRVATPTAAAVTSKLLKSWILRWGWVGEHGGTSNDRDKLQTLHSNNFNERPTDPTSASPRADWQKNSFSQAHTHTPTHRHIYGFIFRFALNIYHANPLRAKRISQIHNLCRVSLLEWEYVNNLQLLNTFYDNIIRNYVIEASVTEKPISALKSMLRKL